MNRLVYIPKNKIDKYEFVEVGDNLIYGWIHSNNKIFSCGECDKNIINMESVECVECKTKEEI